MRSDVRSVALEDCVDALIDYRGKTPRKVDTGIPLITAKVVKKGRIADPTEFVSEDDYGPWMTRGLPEIGDVVITTEAPLGEVGQIQRLPVALAQRIVTLRGKKGVLDNDFLLYLMQSENFQAQLRGRSSGTTVVGIKQSELRKITLELPPIQEQVHIGATLKALDDRAELLRQTNATLKKLSQALFKSWFVDFDPVRAKAEGRELEGMDSATAALFPNDFVNSELGPIPKGWSLSSIGEHTAVIDCLHAKKPELLPTGKPYLQLNCIGEDGQLIPASAGLISEDDYKKWTSRIEVSQGDCVITNVGRVGAVAQIPSGFRAAIGRNMTAIRPKFGLPPTFLIELLMSDSMKREIQQKTDAGTILNALNVKSIPMLRFVHAPADVLNRFEAVSRPLRAAMEANLQRSDSLAAIRDTLLPRLVSGSLRLPDALNKDDPA